MAAQNVKIEVHGVKETVAALEALGQRVYNRVLRSAVSKAARPIVKAAKASCPVGRTGALKKSLGFVVRTYGSGVQGGRGVVLAVIGPRRDAATTRRINQKRGVKVEPANYAHLVEFGHRVAVGGTLERVQKLGWTDELAWNKRLRTMTFKFGAPGRAQRSKRTGIAGGGKVAGQVPAQPFLRPAFDSQKSQAMEALREALEEGIEREEAKLA